MFLNVYLAEETSEIWSSRIQTVLVLLVGDSFTDEALESTRTSERHLKSTREYDVEDLILNPHVFLSSKQTFQQYWGFFSPESLGTHSWLFSVYTLIFWQWIILRPCQHVLTKYSLYVNRELQTNIGISKTPLSYYCFSLLKTWPWIVKSQMDPF